MQYINMSKHDGIKANSELRLIYTLSLMSRTCKTRVGPSVVTLIDKNPEPGRNFCLPTRCSIGGGLPCT